MAERVYEIGDRVRSVDGTPAGAGEIVSTVHRGTEQLYVVNFGEGELWAISSGELVPAPRKLRVFDRYGGDEGGLVWIIITGTSEVDAHIVDVLSYKADGYLGVRNKHGYVKTFSSAKDAQKWARKHPERLMR